MSIVLFGNCASPLRFRRSVAGDGFLGVEEDAGELGPGGVFDGVEGGFGGEADVGEFGGVFGGGFEGVALGLEEGGEGVEFFGFGVAVEGEVVGLGEAGGVGASFVLKETGCEDAGGFDEGGVVEEGEGLLGGVAVGAGGGAFVASGGVEVGHHGMEEGALPVGVDAAAPLAGVGVGDVVAIGELEGFVVVVGLIGFDGGAADVFEVEEAGDGEGVVADELGFEAAGILGGEEAIGGIL